MGVFLVLLLGFLVLSGSLAGMLILRGKTRGLRSLLLAPIPVAITVGIFATAYFAAYASDYVAVTFFVILFMFAAWAVGFVCCVLITAIGKLLARKM